MVEKKELLYDGVYYDITYWMKKHPGGRIIELYVTTGEDCALAAQQFHYRSTKKVMSIMKSLPHRKLNEDDNNKNKIDPVKQEKWKSLTEDFVKLYKEVETEGFFKPDPLHVFIRLSEVFLLLAVGVCLIKFYPETTLLRAMGILITALGAKRCAWVMHEGGHHSLFGNPTWDRRIQNFLNGVILGLSGSYWRYEHNTHHAMPQHIEHDIDLDTVPFLAFHKDKVKNSKDGKSFPIQNQHWLFLLVDTLLITIAWKFWRHPVHCLSEKKYLDLVYMTVNFVIFSSSVGVTNFLLILWLASNFVLFNGVIPHTFLPVTNEPAHWVESALIYSANLRSSWWVDWWTGYVNYQIEHHLFPTMPQYRLKLCRDRVKHLAKKHNLPYNLFSYWEGAKKCLQNLETVSKHLANN